MLGLCLALAGCGSSGKKLTRGDVVETMRGLPGHHWLVHGPGSETMIYGKVAEDQHLTKFIVELDPSGKSAAESYLGRRYSGSWFPYSGGEWSLITVGRGSNPQSDPHFIGELEERLCRRTLGTACPP
jgi:hypothetical protein